MLVTYTTLIIANCVSFSVTGTKYLEKINFKEEGFILAHSIRGFSTGSADSIAFRPVMRQSITVERSVWQSKVAYFMADRKEEGSGDKIYSPAKFS
jgi:hypothetical protein